MARFYFHLEDNGSLVEDPEGTDLPDLGAARQEAVLAARELLIWTIKMGKRQVPEAVVIADEAGQTLEVLPLASVLPDSLR